MLWSKSQRGGERVEVDKANSSPGRSAAAQNGVVPEVEPYMLDGGDQIMEGLGEKRSGVREEELKPGEESAETGA
jgi:hypothetical protein